MAGWPVRQHLLAPLQGLLCQRDCFGGLVLPEKKFVHPVIKGQASRASCASDHPQ